MLLEIKKGKCNIHIRQTLPYYVYLHSKISIVSG